MYVFPLKHWRAIWRSHVLSPAKFQCVEMKVLGTQSCPTATAWPPVHQIALSMGFSRQEHWSGLSFPLPGGLHDRGTKPRSPVSPVLPVDSLPTAAATKSLQSCPSLCDPIDGSPPGSPVPGILQAKTLEWVAISFSNA